MLPDNVITMTAITRCSVQNTLMHVLKQLAITNNDTVIVIVSIMMIIVVVVVVLLLMIMTSIFTITGCSVQNTALACEARSVRPASG